MIRKLSRESANCSTQRLRVGWPRIALPIRWMDAMPGLTEKSRKYLELAAENDKRAAEALNPELKRISLELAAGYRDLAELLDDPVQWRAKLVASVKATRKIR